MKLIFTLFLAIITASLSAQWSNTTNLFTDSLHMQVTNAPYNQGASILVRSYPDSGYFVIWQDSRNDHTNSNAVIYAQKYDKTGVALWAANGVPISSSTNNQHYTYGGQNYRNHSYAATDSAGGFYITYADDSINTYVWERACVQHVKNDGSAVFGGAGYILRRSTAASMHLSPQLIADGTGGFFVSYEGSAPVVGTPNSIFIYCYKDINGTLQNFGGGQMNENAIETINSSPCGNYRDVTYRDAEVKDYNIYSDLEGGCNVIMQLSINGQGPVLGYNKLWRVKKNSTVTEYYSDVDYTSKPYVIYYQQGNVYRLYYLKTDHQDISCGGGGGNIYALTQYRLIQNGFQEIDGGANIYDFTDPKGVTVSTSGNINVSFLATCERNYSSTSGVSSPFARGYSVAEEMYDSIPYQRTSNTNPGYPGYNTVAPASMNKLGFFRDTILGTAISSFDFSLSGGSNQIFSAAVFANYLSSDFTSEVRLQHLAVEQQTADSFAVVYKTSKKIGELIGKDNGDTRYGTEYDLPIVKVNNNGVGLFYVKDNGFSGNPIAAPRLSPIFHGAELAWGAMGKFIGTGVWNGSYYSMSSPNVALDPTNGTGLMSWSDSRNNSTTGYDVYMRHLDNLNDPNYLPPYPSIKAVWNPYGPGTGSAVMYGTSNHFTTFEVYDTYGTQPGVSPVVDISDNYNLGNVNVSVYENTGSIRTSNGKPYLNRSFTITPEHNPNGAATVSIRLFFTTAEFNALKAADPTIKTPGDLEVIKQPSGSGSTYSVVAGEQAVLPQSWAAVSGGYYIEIEITSFSNFFIFKNPNAVPLPVTWLGVQAQWENATQANVSWQVASQQNVKTYTVQHSTNGIDYTDACTVAGLSQTQYNCVAPASSGTNYYRVLETDIDGRKSYSQTVVLQSGNAATISLYPNPAKDALYITGLQSRTVSQVIDMEGRLLQQQTLLSGTQSINVSGLAKGSYLVKLISNADVQTLRFSKE